MVHHQKNKLLNKKDFKKDAVKVENGVLKLEDKEVKVFFF
jgi:hypothetical protein